MTVPPLVLEPAQNLTAPSHAGVHACMHASLSLAAAGRHTSTKRHDQGGRIVGRELGLAVDPGPQFWGSLRRMVWDGGIKDPLHLLHPETPIRDRMLGLVRGLLCSFCLCR